MAIKRSASVQKTRSVKKRTALLASVFVLLCACGDGEESAAPETGAGPEKVAATMAKTSGTDADSVEQCLVDNSKTPCNILEGKITAAFAPEGAQLTTESSEFAGNVSCRIHWDGGRTMEIGAAHTLTVPATDELLFGAVSRQTDGADEAARLFAMNYLSHGEDQQTAAAAESADAGTAFANIRFDAVGDVGDAAAWGGSARVKTLWVRVGATRFEVVANLGDDSAANREASIRLARQIIARCE